METGLRLSRTGDRPVRRCRRCASGSDVEKCVTSPAILHAGARASGRWETEMLVSHSTGALIFLILTILVALAFDFTNGFHDTANAIATSISTRVLAPRVAILMAAILNFVGAFVSTNVAKTIGSDVASSSSLTSVVVMSALLAAIFWNLLTWYYGLPSSSSHALIGGLIGAAVAGAGTFNVLKLAGIIKIVLSLILSPIIGFILAYLLGL